MLSAVGASPSSTAIPYGNSSVGLQTQLAQSEIKLADWVSCPSCHTPEAKAKIAEWSDKVSAIKQKIAQADTTRQLAQQRSDTVKPISLEDISSSSLRGVIKDRVVDVFA